MTSKVNAELSMSQEDYLEAILDLARLTGVARVRDIAERMHVAKSSVTVALRSLARRKLVHYEPYQLVTLTKEGQSLASRVRSRHNALSDFFKDLLDVEESVADANACRIEHAVDDGVLRRLRGFVEFMSESLVPAKELPLAFREYWARCGQGDGCEVAGKESSQDQIQAKDSEIDTTLADLKPGQTAKILRVAGAAAANKRLMEMGLTQGAKVTVVRVAPLGDPIEVMVRGYNLSLRKTEAEAVEVERTQ